MKKMLSSLLVTLCLSATAHAASFYYTSGNLRGQVADHTGYMGYYSVCYTGNPWKARVVLESMATGDIEKDDVSVWFDQKSRNIEFTYISTKCMDDSLDATPEGCRSDVVIPSCK